jgi:L-malate glycosyltransferase
MKILQVIQKTQLRGAEIFACQLSAELINNGFAVDVVYLFDDRNELKKAFPNLNFINLNGVKKNRFWDFSAYKKLADLIKSARYDLVQANAGDTLKYCGISKLIFHWKAPLVFRNANKISDFMQTFLQKMFNNVLIREVDYVISVSENCKDDINRLFPETTKKSVAISIGSYLFDHLIPAKEKSETPVWINIGSFVKEKNHNFLIDLFHEFIKRNKRGTLWLVGDGPLVKVIKQKVDGLSLTDRVIFWGARIDAVSILKSADLLVMPSKIEGLPGVILEAFSCEIPVVVSHVGGIPEIVRHGETGMCIEGYSTDDFCEAVELLTNDLALRERICRDAKKLFIEKYHMTKIALRFQEKYSELNIEQK